MIKEWKASAVYDCTQHVARRCSRSIVNRSSVRCARYLPVVVVLRQYLVGERSREVDACEYTALSPARVTHVEIVVNARVPEGTVSVAPAE